MAVAKSQEDERGAVPATVPSRDQSAGESSSKRDADAPSAAVEKQGTAKGVGVLGVFAERSRNKRIGASIALASIGAASTTAGLVLDLSLDQGYGKVFWIGGLGSIGVAAMNLFLPSATELLYRRYEKGETTDLEPTWRKLARVSRSMRLVNGYVNLGLGAASLGVGIVFAAGAGTMNDDTRGIVVLATMLGGGSILGRGIAALLVPTDIEQAYAMAYGGLPKRSASSKTVSFGVIPTRAGALAGLSGSF